MTLEEAKALAVQMGCKTVREARGLLAVCARVTDALHEHFGPATADNLGEVCHMSISTGIICNLSEVIREHEEPEQDAGSMTYKQAMSFVVVRSLQPGLARKYIEENRLAIAREHRMVADALECGPEGDPGAVATDAEKIVLPPGLCIVQEVGFPGSWHLQGTGQEYSVCGIEVEDPGNPPAGWRCGNILANEWCDECEPETDHGTALEAFKGGVEAGKEDGK